MRKFDVALFTVHSDGTVSLMDMLGSRAFNSADEASAFALELFEGTTTPSEYIAIRDPELGGWQKI